MDNVNPIPNTGMIMISPSYQLIKEDLAGWTRKAIVLIAPMGLLYTSYVINNLSDGFTVNDLIPNSVLVGSIVYFIMTSLTDLFTRYVGSTKYRV